MLIRMRRRPPKRREERDCRTQRPEDAAEERKRQADRKLLQRKEPSPLCILRKVHQRVLMNPLRTTMLAVAQMTYGALSSIFVLC